MRTEVKLGFWELVKRCFQGDKWSHKCQLQCFLNLPLKQLLQSLPATMPQRYLLAWLDLYADVHNILKTSSTDFFIVSLSLPQLSSQFMYVLPCAASECYLPRFTASFLNLKRLQKITRWQQSHFSSPVLVTDACSGVLFIATVTSFPGYTKAAIPTEKIPTSFSARCMVSIWCLHEGWVLRAGSLFFSRVAAISSLQTPIYIHVNGCALIVCNKQSG